MPLSAQRGITVSQKSIPLFSEVASFDTWVEGLPNADYSESVYADFSVIERGLERVVIQRFVRDNNRHIYVRYLATATRLATAHSLKVTFSDTAGLPVEGLPPREQWKIISPAAYPFPQVVRWGDEIPVRLFQGEDGVELIDYIQFAPKDKIQPRSSVPRDSYAEDAEFTLTKTQLRVNGAHQDSVSLPETLQASVLWIYAPGHGRYVLAYSPHPEFGLERFGEVSANHMTLVVDGNLFRLDCRERIAPGGGVYNVYGVRDPGWQPADPKDQARFMLGTSPSLETATRR